MDWCRLHNGVSTDPKWRVIAKRAGHGVRPGDVLAVWTYMMDQASQGSERGVLAWDAEDAAAALDYEVEEVEAIYHAMQGKVLTGDRLTAWEARQPKREREDPNATERKRQQREREKVAAEQAEGGCVTMPKENGHAMSRHVTPRGEESRGEESTPPPYSPPPSWVGLEADPPPAEPDMPREPKPPDKSSRRKPLTAISEDWRPNEAGIAILVSKGFSDDDIRAEANQFRASAEAHDRRYRNWDAAWRKWCSSDFCKRKAGANGAGRGGTTPGGIVALARKLAAEARQRPLEPGADRGAPGG